MQATAEKIRKIAVMTKYGTVWEVDPWAGESEMRANCGRFFHTAHGSRETYTVHRGCLIVRNTVKFTGLPPQRRTVVYLYGYTHESERMDMWCVTHRAGSVREAKRVIDAMLESGSIPSDYN